MLLGVPKYVVKKKTYRYVRVVVVVVDLIVRKMRAPA